MTPRSRPRPPLLKHSGSCCLTWLPDAGAARAAAGVGPEGFLDRRAQGALARVRGGRRVRSVPTRGRTAGHARQAVP
eukprot:9257543-Alexandrium_andersonii.AAC.1